MFSLAYDVQSIANQFVDEGRSDILGTHFRAGILSFSRRCGTTTTTIVENEHFKVSRTVTGHSFSDQCSYRPARFTLAEVVRAKHADLNFAPPSTESVQSPARLKRSQVAESAGRKSD